MLVTKKYAAPVNAKIPATIINACEPVPVSGNAGANWHAFLSYAYTNKVRSPSFAGVGWPGWIASRCSFVKSAIFTVTTSGAAACATVFENSPTRPNKVTITNNFADSFFIYLFLSFLTAEI